MSRLTNKDTKIKLSNTKKYDLEDHKMYNKLEQYEDIEELCEKIREQKVYCILSYGAIWEYDYTKNYDILYSFSEKEIEIFDYTGEYQRTFLIEEYGKEWSFDKEDLEK